MRLREIRGRTTQHFHFLLKELVPFTKLTKLSILRPGDTGFLALFDAFFSKPFVERSDVNTEVLRDLRECDLRAAIQRDPDDVVTELSGVTRGHRFILPGQPKLAMSNVT
ncbi:hypothetical protein EDF60_1341 [Leucobacter luti]|uniref:hypothetical protein n=1 Tax=Leucobacter luti TaxID=340320 RepID=UPI0010DA5285|nr:hypothetical protein [Leucobacter luti]TCK46094.1 hypothetical protein EDF60_1341 [Leucobacter luti]